MTTIRPTHFWKFFNQYGLVVILLLAGLFVWKARSKRRREINKKYNPNELEKTIQELYLDDEVNSKKGIYEYLLSGDEKSLNLRTFTSNQKAQGYEACKGICASCSKHFDVEEMEADHIDP